MIPSLKNSLKNRLSGNSNKKICPTDKLGVPADYKIIDLKLPIGTKKTHCRPIYKSNMTNSSLTDLLHKLLKFDIWQYQSHCHEYNPE